MTLTLFRLFALILATLFAGTSPGTKENKWLLSYFAAHLVTYLVALPVLLGGFGVETRTYAAMFTVLTFGILAASAGYAFQQFRAMPKTLRWVTAAESIALPVFLVSVAAMLLKDKIPYLRELYPGQRFQGVAIALGESGALLALGIALGTVSAVTPQAFQGRILALLWLCLGAWRCAFAIGLTHAEKFFRAVNDWIPFALVVFFFLLYGCVERVRAGHATQPQCSGKNNRNLGDSLAKHR